MKKKLIYLLIALCLIVVPLVDAIPIDAILKTDSVVFDGVEYQIGEEIASQRGRASAVEYLGNDTYQTTFHSSPDFTSVAGQWVEYDFQDIGGYYQVQHPWSSVKFYDYYTEVWNEEFTEVKVYDDRWVVEYLNKQGRWTDTGFWGIVRSYEIVSDGIKLKRFGSTDIGLRQEIYYFRNGSPCKIEIQQICDDAQTVRFVWKPSGIVATTEKNIIPDETDKHDGKNAGINFYDVSGNFTQTIRWYDELDICDNISPVIESHAQGRKATVTFSEFNVSAGGTAILDPEIYYPDADAEATSVDGTTYRQAAANWDTLQAGAGTTGDDLGNELTVGIFSAGAGEWWTIWKGITLFDTSALPDTAVIESAVYSLYGSDKNAGLNEGIAINVYTSNPATDTAIIAADHTTLGTTVLSTEIAYAAWSLVAYNDFTLNATGEGTINTTGITKLGVRESNFDAPDVPPAHLANWAFDDIQAWTADQGGATKPKLTVAYTFSSADAQWYYNGGDWQFRLKITIDSTLVDADLVNFPVLITEDDMTVNFWAEVQADGEDIVVTSSDGETKLKRELVSIDTGLETMELWFKAPTLSSTINAIFYLYYGNAGAAETNDTDTWDTNFMAVYHMNDDPDNAHIADSTSNGNDGAKKGANEPIEAAGIIGQAQDFDGADDDINLGSGASLDIVTAITTECILNLDINSWNHPSSIYFIIKPTFNYAFYYVAVQNKLSLYSTGTIPIELTVATLFTAGTPYAIASTYDSVAQERKLFVNGAQIGATQATSGTMTIDTLSDGALSDAAFTINGKQDEVRISDIARSVAWLTTTNNTETDPAGFYFTEDEIPAIPTVTTDTWLGFENHWITLRGTVVDADIPVICTQAGFDYGLTTGYGSEILLTGSWEDNEDFVGTTFGLAPGTIYHYRAKAYNVAGWAYGVDKVFNTEGSATMYENYTTGGDADSVDIFGVSWVAQQFTASDCHTVTSVRLILKRVLLPGTVTVSIRHANPAHEPTGLDLSSGTMDGDTLLVGYALYEIPITEVYLEAGEEYAIVVRAVAGDAANRILWQKDAGGGLADAIGSDSGDGGLTWAVDGGGADYMFEVWGFPCLDIEGAQVFSGYLEDDDLLFVMAGENLYTPYYPDQSSETYFAIQLLHTDGVTVMHQTRLKQWGYKPSAIYLSANSASALTEGSLYYMFQYGDFTGNPVSSYQLQAADWRGTDLTFLDEWVLTTARSMATYYDTELTTFTGAGEMLNEEGGIIFSIGIPALEQVRPHLFQAFTPAPEYEATTWTDAFAGATTWDAQVGTTVATGFTTMGSLVGIDGKAVGAFLLLAFYLAIALAVVGRGGDATIAIIIAIPFILLGAWLRLIDIAIIAITASVTVLLLIYRFWFSRT